MFYNAATKIFIHFFFRSSANMVFSLILSKNYKLRAVFALVCCDKLVNRVEVGIFGHEVEVFNASRDFSRISFEIGCTKYTGEVSNARQHRGS